MQKDLFAGAGGATISSLSGAMPSRVDFLERHRISLRWDQAIVMLIMFLVAYVLIFSFGVETGKRYAMEELKAERSKRERMGEEFRQRLLEKRDPAGGSSVILPALATAGAPGTAQAARANSSGKTSVLEPPKAGQTPAVSVDSDATLSAPKQGKGKYTIQVVTLKSKDAAMKQIQALAAKGQQGFILTRGNYVEVCVSGFETQREARQSLDALKSRGIVPADAYIRGL